jgi:hypothetical protein
MKRVLHRISPIRKDDPPMKSLLTLSSLLLQFLVLGLCIAYNISGWLVLAMIAVPVALFLLGQRIPGMRNGGDTPGRATP